MELGPETSYRNFPEYRNYSKNELRWLIFCQGLSTPEVYHGPPPEDYDVDESRWYE